MSPYRQNMQSDPHPDKLAKTMASAKPRVATAKIRFMISPENAAAVWRLLAQSSSHVGIFGRHRSGRAECEPGPNVPAVRGAIARRVDGASGLAITTPLKCGSRGSPNAECVFAAWPDLTNDNFFWFLQIMRLKVKSMQPVIYNSLNFLSRYAYQEYPGEACSWNYAAASQDCRLPGVH
jgi:hypothetical protein